jgi:hypothetical protein
LKKIEDDDTEKLVTEEIEMLCVVFCVWG